LAAASSKYTRNVAEHSDGEELIMGATTIRQQIASMIDELPPDVLPELAEFIDFLRFKAVRAGLTPQVHAAIHLYVAGEVSLGRAAEMAEAIKSRYEANQVPHSASVMKPVPISPRQ